MHFRSSQSRRIGGCWVPNKAWPGIVFSHWGRLEVNHTSNTDYGPDDYSKPFVSADMDGDWRDAFKGHPCFDPKKVRVTDLERGCGWQRRLEAGVTAAAAGRCNTHMPLMSCTRCQRLSLHTRGVASVGKAWPHKSDWVCAIGGMRCNPCRVFCWRA